MEEMEGRKKAARKVQDGQEGKDKLNKKISNEQTSEETAMSRALFVEKFMAKLDAAAEADEALKGDSKPAIEKLTILPKLLNVLEKRHLQQECLDRGLLSSLKNWLQPRPDGSLPNVIIRSALLKLLTDLPINVEVFERREQLKKSGLEKAVLFLSTLAEETPVNKKLARDLVLKWSRPIFQRAQCEEERPEPGRMLVTKLVSKLRVEVHPERKLKPGDPGYQYRASIPEALTMSFVVRPASKVDAEALRANTKRQRMEAKRSKLNQKLERLRKRNKTKLQASRLSVDGRGLI